MAPSKRNRTLYWIYALAFLLLLGMGILLGFLPRTPSGIPSEHQDYRSALPESEEPPSPLPLQEPPGGEEPPKAPEAAPAPPAPLSPKPRILYFVMDDGGHNLSQLESFLKFPGKITIAVIPFLRYSEEAARRTVKAGKSLILHMPMEALNEDAGKGAIKAGDNAATVARKLEEALRDVPGASGVNNHMGSRATADLSVMKSVLKFLDEKDLFFLDSHTNPGSMARAAGEALNITVWERNVFLDNEKNREYILHAIEEGKKIADKKGHAVMIGHVWTSELAEVLTEIYPQLLEQGYTLEDLSHLFALQDDDDSTGY